MVRWETNLRCVGALLLWCVGANPRWPGGLGPASWRGGLSRVESKKDREDRSKKGITTNDLNKTERDWARDSMDTDPASMNVTTDRMARD